MALFVRSGTLVFTYYMLIDPRWSTIISFCDRRCSVCFDYLVRTVAVCPVRVLVWSGGVMVLGKLPVPGRPANYAKSRTRPVALCSEFGWGWFEHFFSRLSFLFSFSLSLGDGPI